MSCDRYARMIIKRGQGLPTIPPSADHRNGDWLDTDIYEGELYQDTDTGVIYTRSNGTIISVDGPTAKTYEALLTQTGTGNPTAVVNENTIGAISWSRVNAGHYRGTRATAFTNNKTHPFIQSMGNDDRCYISRQNANVIEVFTTNSAGTLTDGILDSTAIRIKVYA